jgi:hypothetical protein
VRLKVNPRIAWQVIDDEAVLVDLVDQHAIGLSPSATLIWSMVTDSDEDCIVQALIDEFDVDPQTARRDLRGFVDACLARSFLVPTDSRSS